MKSTQEFLAEVASSKNAKKIDQIAQMTDYNNHNGAMIEGAKLLGAKKLQKIFESIAAIQDAEGSMPPDLMKYRQYKYKEMMKLAKKQMLAGDYSRFHGAF